VGLYDWRNGQPLAIGGSRQLPGPVAFLDDTVTVGE
jgi:hypothetical protein